MSILSPRAAAHGRIRRGDFPLRLIPYPRTSVRWLSATGVPLRSRRCGAEKTRYREQIPARIRELRVDASAPCRSFGSIGRARIAASRPSGTRRMMAWIVRGRRRRRPRRLRVTRLRPRRRQCLRRRRVCLRPLPAEHSALLLCPSHAWRRRVVGTICGSPAPCRARAPRRTRLHARVGARDVSRDRSMTAPRPRRAFFRSRGNSVLPGPTRSEGVERFVEDLAKGQGTDAAGSKPSSSAPPAPRRY